MYFIDVQGTIIDDIDKSPVDGAIEFIDNLNKTNQNFMIITNNTKRPSIEFYEFLLNKGFDIPKKSYLDPLMVIQERVKEKNVAGYGDIKFLNTLETLGYTLDYKTPDAVIIAIKEDFTHEEYAQIIELLLNGAKLIGMHESTIYAKNSKRYPGVGSILKMLQFATGVDYEIVGKPSVSFYNKALSMSSATNFHEVTIISDDVKGDLVGAKELGMKTIFVLSGKYKSSDEVLPSIDIALHPDIVCKSIKRVDS